MNILSHSIFLRRGGVHPEEHKGISSGLPVATLPIPQMLYVSTAQHIGSPSKPVVKKGSHVLRGQAIAEPVGYVSSRLHAPTSGTVSNLYPSLSMNGRSATIIEITTDGEDRPDTSLDISPICSSLSAAEIIDRIFKAGIIGMGGAGFPTHVKVSLPPGKTVDTLLLNGAECEPWLTSDHRLMMECPERIVEGARYLRTILNCRQLFVCVEENKPDAIRSLETAIHDLKENMKVLVLASIYPQGSEKQLIHAVTKREVPSGKLPMDVGVIVENVGTASAIADAVDRAVPQISRIVTLGGDCIAQPCNVKALIGTPIRDLINYSGGLRMNPDKLLAGGPMMGIALPSVDVGISKTTSGILALSKRYTYRFESTPCISCGRCVAACPMSLMPCRLSEYLEVEQIATAEEWNIMDCIECGACAYVCPSHRPLVQHLRHGKARIMLSRRRRESTSKPGMS